MKKLLLVLLSASATAFAADAPASRQEEGEFQQWLIHRAGTFPLRPFEVNTINIALHDKPIKVRLYSLSEIVGRDDAMLSRYLDLIEKNRDKNEQINPFDRQLLTALRRFDIPAKRARLDRFDQVTHSLGIDDPPFGLDAKEWKDGLSAAAKGGPSSRRYDPETGLYERLDEAKKEWVREKPAAPK